MHKKGKYRWQEVYLMLVLSKYLVPQLTKSFNIGQS